MGVPIARVFGIEIRVQVGWAVVLGVVAVIIALSLVSERAVFAPLERAVARRWGTVTS